jgi:hypothetical protein
MSYGYRRRGGLVGPVVLITVGTLILLDRWLPDYSFHRLWPVILIVIGVVKLLEMGMARDNEEVRPQPPYIPPGSSNPPPPSSGASQ